MKGVTLASAIVIWYVLTTCTSHATSLGHGNVGPLNLDSVSKLAEHLTKISDQLNQLSENQAKHSNQLHEVSNRLKIIEEEKIVNDNVKKEVITQISELEQRIRASSAGPTFIRWGRQSCNETNSEIVYLGLAVGTNDGEPGGGGNLLCLPRNPTFGNYDSVDRPGAEVDVAEYKLDVLSNFPFEHNDPLLLDNNVPCAVCEVTNGSSVMMIPARVDCYTGWRMEYRGYLMAEEDNTYRIDFVCVDANPEVVNGGSGPTSYGLGLYPTVASTNIGSLPSPPYGEDWELACVVCSK